MEGCSEVCGGDLEVVVYDGATCVGAERDAGAQGEGVDAPPPGAARAPRALSSHGIPGSPFWWVGHLTCLRVRSHQLGQLHAASHVRIPYQRTSPYRR